jgi:hypothetical protein
VLIEKEQQSMTHSSAAAGLFGSIARKPQPELDIPIVTCPSCEKRRPMTIKRIVPHMRKGDGAKVEFRCATCGMTERRTVKPV